MITIYFLRGFTAGGQHQAGRQLLERIYGGRLEWTFGPSGKPYGKNIEGYFNLSHSAAVVAAATGPVEMGFDLEGPRRNRLKNFARPEEREIDLKTLWVIKESFVKLTGEGLAGLRSTSVQRSGSGQYTVFGGGRKAVVQVFPYQDHICALATAQPEPYRLVEWQLEV